MTLCSTHAIEGGYSLLTAAQLAHVLSALTTKRISFYTLRTYFACMEMKEARKAFYTSQPKQAVRGRYSHYRTEEIAALLGAKSTRLIPAALRALDKLSLLSFSQKSIHIPSETPEVALELLEACHLGRTPRRKIPVPRRILRFLARCSQVSVAKTLIFYLLRGLTLKRGGLVQSKGTMKSSLLARLGSLSLRAVRAARQVLIASGLITPDQTHSQRKLNRTGVFFTINLSWNPKADVVREQPPRTEDQCSHPSPLSPPQSSDSAPPIKKHKTSNEGRNQKLCSRTGDSGGSKKVRVKAPSLSRITAEDLGDLSRLQQLYQQAVKRQWVQRSEANWLTWVAAAVRARRQGASGGGVRLFVALVQRQLYHHITHDEEDEARRIIQEHRECDPWGEAAAGLVHQVLTRLRPKTLQTSSIASVPRVKKTI